jgi:uncharacterized membrane protein YdbT with pleckstrin-like domain
VNIHVTATEGLTIATLIVALISMVLSCMALWPQWKDKVAKVRDMVLWMALVAVVVAVVTMAWNRYADHGSLRFWQSQVRSVNG